MGALILRSKDAPLDVVVRFCTATTSRVKIAVRNTVFDYDAPARTLKRGGPATVIHPDASLDARFLVDVGIVESFWNGGEAACSAGSLHTDAGPAFVIKGDAVIEELTVYPMSNIWPQSEAANAIRLK